MKYFVIAFFGLALMATSCKKEGCTDLDATNFDGKAKKDDGSCVYDTPPVVIDTICDGLQIDNTFWPLYSGVFRKYEVDFGTADFTVTEQVLGQVLISGVLWYEVRVISTFGGSPTETIKNYRKDAFGNLYVKNGAAEDLVMPAIPELGQQILTDYYITDLNASKSTAECNYTGCIKATQTDGIITKNIWFKRGVGKVAYDGGAPLGDDDDQLTIIHD